MYTGWAKPFIVNREIDLTERRCALPPSNKSNIKPFAYSALISFNSTYADFIDRRFRLRGMFGTLLASLVALGATACGIHFFTSMLPEAYASGRVGLLFVVVAAVMVGLFTFGMAFMFWRIFLRQEFFAYTHYPIRFNRKTRKVHVFRHNSPGGVLTVPFDEVFWHVGRGLRDKYLCDVRGHVLDGERVKETFAVGHYFDDSRMDRIYSLWEFIRRYMQEGPEAVAEHPLDRTIDLSMRPTWTNCYTWVAASMGSTMQSLRFLLFFLYYPLVGLLTLTRWLVLKSCKTPQWPAEIEAECQVSADDPHRWEKPNYMWEFANRDGAIERELERERVQQRQKTSI